uniref:Uncharacterized protein n=1 Tax=Populus trichocarpa TaxID=3694 RepID=A0A2K2BD13_POPTR
MRALERYSHFSENYQRTWERKMESLSSSTKWGNCSHQLYGALAGLQDLFQNTPNLASQQEEQFSRGILASMIGFPSDQNPFFKIIFWSRTVVWCVCIF